jgi:hypothetical protein
MKYDETHIVRALEYLLDRLKFEPSGRPNLIVKTWAVTHGVSAGHIAAFTREVLSLAPIAHQVAIAARPDSRRLAAALQEDRFVPLPPTRPGVEPACPSHYFKAAIVTRNKRGTRGKR